MMLRRFEVVRFGCNSHKFDNTLKSLDKAFNSVWDAHPHWSRPRLMPNKWKVEAVRQAEAARATGASDGGGGEEAAAPADGNQAPAQEPRGHPEPLESGVRAGGLYFARLVSFLVASPDPRENGIQNDWKEWVAVKDEERKPAEPITGPLEVLGKARFHETLCASGPLFVRAEDLKVFLEGVKMQKGAWGNMEQNVHDGLNDIPTLMELALQYILFYEVAFPSMAAKKLYNNHWVLSDMYDNFELALRSLQEDISPLLTGLVDEVRVVLRVREDGHVSTELAMRPLHCLLGPGIKRPRGKLISKIREWVSELSMEHKEQFEALARAAVDEMLPTFLRFARDQLSSQDGDMLKNMQSKYGVNMAVHIELTNDR